MSQMLRRGRRLLGLRPASMAAVLRSEATWRHLTTDDPMLRRLVGAVRTPAPQEPEWRARVERIRRDLESSTERVLFELEPGGEEYWRRAIPQSDDPDPPRLEDGNLSRSKGEITRMTSTDDVWGRVFFRIVRALQPARCLELGTSVGMSGCYIAAGLRDNGHGRLVTIEGQWQSAEVARDAFRSIGVADIVDVRVGSFADEMPNAIRDLGGVDLAFIDGHHQYQPTVDYFQAIVAATAPGGLLIFDDVVYDLGDMARAWAEIRDDPHVTGSLTIGTIGFAVIDGLPADHLTLGRLPRLR